MIRFVIDEPAFRRLVAGQVATFKTTRDGLEVEGILADIGWSKICARCSTASRRNRDQGARPTRRKRSNFCRRRSNPDDGGDDRDRTSDDHPRLGADLAQ